MFTSISFLDVVVERSLSSFPTSPILTCRLIVQTFNVLNVHGKKQKTLCTRAEVGCPAEWLAQLQTQVMSPTSPTSSATWTRSTRKSTSVTATTISRATTTHRDLHHRRSRQFAASKSIQQQQANSSKQSSINVRTLKSLETDGRSSVGSRFRTENLLQQRFLVQNRTG